MEIVSLCIFIKIHDVRVHSFNTFVDLSVLKRRLLHVTLVGLFYRIA